MVSEQNHKILKKGYLQCTVFVGNAASKILTWVGWGEEFSCLVSSFVFVAVDCEGAETVLAIGLAISHANPGVLLIRNELIRPNESGLSDICPVK